MCVGNISLHTFHIQGGSKMLNTIDYGFAISRRRSVEIEIFIGTAGNESGNLLVGNFSKDAAFRMLGKYYSDIDKIMSHLYIMNRCRAKNKGA